MSDMDKGEAAYIASLWHSVMNWSDPGVTMYALSSTGRVQSEEHRQDLLDYIDKECMPKAILNDEDPDTLSTHDDDPYDGDAHQLEALREYIVEAPLEPEDKRVRSHI